MKRLLYVTQYYASKGQPGASRHYQHIRNFMAQGYEVTLVTSYVKHRYRVIPPEYEGIKIAEERDGDLRVFKCYAYPNYGADFRTRMLNYLSFMFYALITGLFKASSSDLVLASSPSLFVGLTGYLLSRIRRVPFIFEVRDLWPETAVVMGSLRNPFMIRMATWLAYFLYRRADRVIAVTEGSRGGILKSGVSAQKVVLVPNGVDDDLFATLSQERAQAIREQYGWGDRFVAIYAGTLAASDGLFSIVRAGAALAHYQDILIVFLGDGEVKVKLQALAQELGLDNVAFIPSQPKAQVPDFVSAADVCLVPVKNDPFFAMTLPNKLFDYLAGGRPIIGAVPPGEAQRLIETAGAGLVVPPEDELSLAAALLEMRDHPERRAVYGRNGREYVMKHYLRSILASKLIAAMDHVLQESGAIEPKEMAHELGRHNVSTP